MGWEREERLGLTNVPPEKRREVCEQMYNQQRAENEAKAELYRVAELSKAERK